MIPQVFLRYDALQSIQKKYSHLSIEARPRVQVQVYVLLIYLNALIHPIQA